MEEYKTCPFCGALPRFSKKDPGAPTNQFYFSLQCVDRMCEVLPGIVFKAKLSEEEAIKKRALIIWNSRY